MHIIVASKNPVKVDAIREGFSQMFPELELKVEGISVPSGVSDQPQTEDETLKGATNRVQNAQNARPEADYWVGVEGGIEDQEIGMLAFAWTVIRSTQQEGKARTATFLLPPPVAELVRGGMELGHADDLVFGQSNSKQQNGAVGLLTHNVIVRRTLYVPSVVMALIPFVQEELYLDSVGSAGLVGSADPPDPTE